MKIGLFAIGIGTAAHPGVIRAAAETAERTGFATVWAPEHIVLFDSHESKYPYNDTGKFATPADFDWLDPFLALTYAAAVTSKIRLATGICLVPERNPLILAKEIATLDRLSSGRFALGVGIGWLKEEFDALGVAFERRAQRTREYIDVMRRLWREPVVTHSGEFVRFENARSYPKPPQGAKVPIWFGGESEPALRRVAAYGDGWFGFNLNPAQAGERITRLRALIKERGRERDHFEIIASPYTQQITRDDLKRYRDAGVEEIPMGINLKDNPAEVRAQVEQMSVDWVEPAAKIS
ncbi:MAG: LLM class F420-dependent oxidoreductase [Candidatus Binataceae bacterium]